MSKGKSSIQQKADYQRRQAYTPQQRMNYEECGCKHSVRPPSQIALDQMADEKISGKYKTGRKQICQKHFIAKSLNGKCISCEAEEM